MEKRIIEITIGDGGNIDYSIFNEEIKKLNEPQFRKVISLFNKIRTGVATARAMTLQPDEELETK